MTNLAAVVSRLEQAGGSLALDGERIRYRIPTDNPQVRALLNAIRAEKPALRDFLRSRTAIPCMPQDVRIVEWKLKEPPVAIEVCAVVTDPAKFATSTLGQLRVALENSRRWVGWTIPQLVDRLAQVGVLVTLERVGAD
jgi:hypothetical protein